jgi:hypothetical protein
MDRTIETTRENLESRLDTVGWGLFFLMSGGVLLVPGLPDGSWLVGLGAIFLGLSAVRVSTGLPVSGFGVVVGVVAMAAGASAVAGIAVPWLALLLIACGLAIVARDVTHQVRQA